jgi:serine/threonine protein kinase
LDPAKVKYHRLAKGMSVKDLKDAAGIADETWRRVMRGQPIWMDSAVSIQKALGVDSLPKLLHPAVLAKLRVPDQSASDDDGGLPDWERDEPLSGLVEASNGLKYHVWRLKHRLEANQFARGKRYQLSSLPTREQDRMRAYLCRHADVCNRVARNPRFPQHFTTTPDPREDAYWVIDEWTPGPTLAEKLAHGAIDRSALPRLMRQIAEGLDALHQAQVIRRELSPRFIILSDRGLHTAVDENEAESTDSDESTVRTANGPTASRSQRRSLGSQAR